MEIVKLSFKEFSSKYHFLDKRVVFKSGYTAADITGWVELKPKGFKAQKVWFSHGYICSPMEVFENLTDEEKEIAIWELNEWK